MPKVAMTKAKYNEVMEEVASFREEYEDYDSEMVEEYVRLLEDFNPRQKALFISELGF